MAMTTWSLIPLLLGGDQTARGMCRRQNTQIQRNRVSEHEIMVCAQIQIQMKMSHRQRRQVKWEYSSHLTTPAASGHSPLSTLHTVHTAKDTNIKYENTNTINRNTKDSCRKQADTLHKARDTNTNTELNVQRSEAKYDRNDRMQSQIREIIETSAVSKFLKKNHPKSDRASPEHLQSA